MARALTSPELALLRADGQWTKLYLAVLKPNTIYTARLSSLPGSTDNVHTITFTSGSGTLSDVKPGMTLYVGTSAGAYDLGMCRIRKDPVAGTFYIGLTSEIDWQSNAYLTVVDDFDLWAKHAVIADSALTMDVDVAYSDQHAAFNPVPVLGPHAVLWLEDVTVSVDFDASDSWVFGSTITGYAWSAPGASASSGMTSATPHITYNAAGCYRALCTVTAANGKTTTGVRHVFVYDADHMPATVFQLAQCIADYETGGWMFDLTMEAEASLSELRERSLVILFAEDWYGFPPDQTKQSIGPIEGRENIVCVGRTVGESIRWDRESGMVHFTVQGGHHWLNKIKGFPIQLQPTSVAASWSEMPLMTVDRVLWHLLFWHSTVIETMDFYPSNDTRYSPDGMSMASSIWGQLTDLAFSRLLASPGVDRFGRLFVEVDPQTVPQLDRDFPVVMDLTADDWQEGIDLQRVTVEDVSLIRLTSQLVNESGSSLTLYSLAPGHTPRRYGEPEMIDRLLAASQAESNSLAGLVLGWRTNPFPDVPVIFLQSNRMFDLWPRQYAALTMSADDNPRGVAFDGNLIPRRIGLYFNNDDGYLHPEINFEGETFEQLSSDGDVPTLDDDLSLPPIISLPRLDLPDFPDILPGGIPEPSSDAPPKVLLHDTAVGLVYTENFQDATPLWRTVNAGLTLAQYQAINFVGICRNGAIYVAGFPGDYSGPGFLARAPFIGGTFELQTFADTIVSAAVNPLVSESIAFTTNTGHGHSPTKVYVGADNVFSLHTLSFAQYFLSASRMSYGFGYWLYTDNGGYVKIAPDGSSIVAAGDPDNGQQHIRAATTGRTFAQLGPGVQKGEGNYTTYSNVSSQPITFQPSPSMSPCAADCDPTGTYLMARGLDVGDRCRSSDMGTTWVGIPNLVYGLWRFANAGTTQRWIAANASVQYSKDFGNVWGNKTGNLTGLTPFPNINLIKVVEY